MQVARGWSEFIRVGNWLPILSVSIAMTRLVSQVLAESRRGRLTAADWTGILSRMDHELREVLRRTGHDLPAVRLVTFQDVKPPRRKRKPKAVPAE
jgi:hypothetical protein